MPEGLCSTCEEAGLRCIGRSTSGIGGLLDEMVALNGGRAIEELTPDELSELFGQIGDAMIRRYHGEALRLTTYLPPQHVVEQLPDGREFHFRGGESFPCEDPLVRPIAEMIVERFASLSQEDGDSDVGS